MARVRTCTATRDRRPRHDDRDQRFGPDLPGEGVVRGHVQSWMEHMWGRQALTGSLDRSAPERPHRGKWLGDQVTRRGSIARKQVGRHGPPGASGLGAHAHGGSDRIRPGPQRGARDRPRGRDASVQKTRVQANRVRYDRTANYAWAEVEPVLEMEEKTGTKTEVRGNTLEFDNARRRVTAIGGVQIRREALRATCDRAEFYQSEQRALLLGDPRAWDEEGVARGDTIEITFVDERLESPACGARHRGVRPRPTRAAASGTSRTATRSHSLRRPAGAGGGDRRTRREPILAEQRGQRPRAGTVGATPSTSTSKREADPRDGARREPASTTWRPRRHEPARHPGDGPLPGHEIVYDVDRGPSTSTATPT